MGGNTDRSGFYGVFFVVGFRYYFSDADVMKMAKKLIKDPEHKNKNAQETFQDIAYLSDYQLYQFAQKYSVS
jgi:SWI/SNF-related matrix-associated actin-dependent regulator of chromatin subfamily A containing DEAD/H box 1